MRNLQQLQRQFTAAMAPSVPTDVMAGLCAGIQDGSGLSAVRRLEIYRRNTVGACVQALMQVYPVCRMVLGERCFHTLACDYQALLPSRLPDLNQYGEDFHQAMMAAVARPGFEGMDYLPELARLEWHWHSLYYLADDTAFEHEAFSDAVATPERLCLQPSLCLRLLDARYPVFTLWQAHRKRQTPVDLLPDAQCIVLWRDQFQPMACTIDTALFALLSAVMTAQTLAEMALDGLAVDRLGEVITRGWVVGHRLLPEPLPVASG